MSKSYPSYRFSRCHKMALVRNAEEDNAIAHWHEEPQEGFVSPAHPHFVGVENIPADLLAPVEEISEYNELDEIEEPEEEVAVEAPKKRGRKASYKL